MARAPTHTPAPPPRHPAPAERAGCVRAVWTRDAGLCSLHLRPPLLSVPRFLSSSRSAPRAPLPCLRFSSNRGSCLRPGTHGLLFCFRVGLKGPPPTTFKRRNALQVTPETECSKLAPAVPTPPRSPPVPAPELSKRPKSLSSIVIILRS